MSSHVGWVQERGRLSVKVVTLFVGECQSLFASCTSWRELVVFFATETL